MFINDSTERDLLLSVFFSEIRQLLSKIQTNLLQMFPVTVPTKVASCNFEI